MSIFNLKREFLIKWLGYGPEHHTWEAHANLSKKPELLSACIGLQRKLLIS